MDVLIGTAPGGIPDIYECPNCSKSYLTCEVETNGELRLEFDARNGVKTIRRTVDPPKNCRRCGSPMDVELALKYSDEQAVKAETPAGKAQRVTVKV